MHPRLDKINKLIWDADLSQKPWHQYLSWMVARLTFAVARDVHDGALSLRATSLVYTTLLSLAPLLAICFSVMKGFGATAQIEPFLNEFLRPLGEQGRELTAKLMEFVSNINVGVLGMIGLALLIFSVLSLMQKIESAFNQIWSVSNNRPFILRVRDYLSALLIGPLFMFLSVGMAASLEHQEFMRRWLNFTIVNTALEYVLYILPFLLFTLAFTAIYMFIPNTKVKFIPAYIAAIVTTVMWKGLGWVFATFVAGSANYAAIYSAFAALVLFMIWLYMGWLMLLVGASISYYLQNPTNQRLSRRFRQLSIRVKTKLALMIMIEIGKNFYAQKPHSLTLNEMAALLGVPARAAENIVRNLLHVGILVEAGDGYMPGRPYDTTSVYEALTEFRAANEEEGIAFESLAPYRETDKILELSDRKTREALAGITLKQLTFGEFTP